MDDQMQNRYPYTLAFPTGKKELIFSVAAILCGWFLWNTLCYGGLNLGFAVAAIGILCCSFWYLFCAGCRPSLYCCSLLLLSTLSLAGFARSDDGFVKFILLLFVIFGSSLALCLQAKQNRRDPGSVGSLLDAPRAIFRFGIGGLSEAVCGLREALRNGGTAVKKGGAFLLGLCIAVPILAIMIPLLIRADAAFDGLMKLLPEFKVAELINTLLVGSVLSIFFYTQGVSLRHEDAPKATSHRRKGANAITINTMLCAVCLLYVVYLISQLAYLSGGFAGILPEEFTMAEYARRGFFEMAALSGCNLAVMVLSLGLVQKTDRSPLFTRLLCLFLGLVTLFLIATASAKMFLYIEGYGLSRLRLLTQIIMLFLAITTSVIMLWLFLPKLPYMKVILLCAMVIGAATLWTDVNTQVASYNVNAYLDGQYTAIDVKYLYQLGDSAIPYLAQLAEEAPDENIAIAARNYLKEISLYRSLGDLRDWNYVNHIAEIYLDNTP